MKHINLMSLIQANDSLGQGSFDSFLSLHGIKIKKAEIQDLKGLLNALYSLPSSIGIFDAFYVGYKIPQIGKEFDLLRFGKNFLVNIELKKTSTEEKVRNQLIRNKYYLGNIGRQVHGFTYVSDAATLYYLQDDKSLVKVHLSSLRDLLNQQEVNRAEVVDDLFDPSDYLVSPFNSTRKFLNNEYFLTHQQEDVKDQIIKYLAGPKAAKFISVIGSAGTGKTLLIYDIAKALRGAAKNPIVIHCGYLNEGQEELRRNGWSVVPIKNYASYNLALYDLVIVDETQRIYLRQLKDLVQKIEASFGSCIFSYDKMQTLSHSEEATNIDAQINDIKALVTHKLSEKIRTNKEIATFIKVLFNSKRNLVLPSKNNIEINYFKSLEDARFYLSVLDKAGWEVIRFTPSQYSKEHHAQYSEQSKKTSHQVIGQEFDGVAVTIDRYFSYDANGELCYNGGAYYHAAKMLFQNITRARKRLNLIIIDNEEILSRCVSILQ